MPEGISTEQRLLMFVKAPRPGTVKTRLATALGNQAACAAYRELVAELLDQLRGLAGVELRFAPDDARAEIEPWLQPGWTAVPQGGGALTARLTRAFDASFGAGAKRVIAIGSDCPHVTRADVEAAWQALRTKDVVLGPATDGGYWLIGLGRSMPEIFRDIPWSTSKVFTETLRRAETLHCSVRLLHELSDVDTPADWRRHRQQQRPRPS